MEGTGNIRLQVEFERYARSFKQPLVTNHGVWAVREGIIVRLNGSPGEIAPLEWFGTESLAEAEDFCASLNGWIERSQIFTIPDHLPCCQFAFEMALQGLETSDQLKLSSMPRPATIAALLPTGAAALAQWRSWYRLGHRTFKWKIGVDDIQTEWQQFAQLHHQLPPDCQLRLDANAGLSLSQTHQWLERLAAYPIEYLEQPLPPAQFESMQELSHQYSTVLALDESIANLASLQACYQRGWLGIYVIKPAIVGSPSRLSQFIQTHPIDAVFSSVFETVIGYAAGINLAQTVGADRLALGYGTQNYISANPV